MKRIIKTTSVILFAALLLFAFAANTFAQSNWSVSDQYGGMLKEQGGEIVFNGTAAAIYTADKFENRMISLKVKFTTGVWNAIILRNNIDDGELALNTEVIWPWVGYGEPYVFFILSDGKITLNSYPPVSMESVELTNVEGTSITDGNYHDLQIGAIDVEGGTNVILKLDGVELINYFDKTALKNPLKKPGYIGIASATDNDLITIAELKEAAAASGSQSNAKAPADDKDNTSTQTQANPKTSDGGFVLLGITCVMSAGGLFFRRVRK